MRRATIQDVARLAGVSLSTVSAVINGKNIVAKNTREEILGAIAKLNYHPSLYASNLARHKTRQLGLIVSRLIIHFFPKQRRRSKQKQDGAAISYPWRPRISIPLDC